MIGIIRKTTSSRPPSPKKRGTHERIVEVAARAIRRGGYGGAAVAEIMKEAGLTHGGFYAHFASREAMLAEAVDRAGAESVALAESVASTAPPERALEAMARAYLSKEHLESPETGCPIAALGSETPRQTEEIRRAATRRIEEMLEVVSRHTPPDGRSDPEERALVAMATLVGTLVLARAVDDPHLSDSLVAATIKSFTTPESD